MAASLKLNANDGKQVIIALALSIGGVLYWRYKKANSSGSSNSTQALNNASASNGTAGAISPGSTINTFDVFPSSTGSSTPFYNKGHSRTVPNLYTGSTTNTNGQTYSLPLNS